MVRGGAARGITTTPSTEADFAHHQTALPGSCDFGVPRRLQEERRTVMVWCRMMMWHERERDSIQDAGLAMEREESFELGLRHAGFRAGGDSRNGERGGVEVIWPKSSRLTERGGSI